MNLFKRITIPIVTGIAAATFASPMFAQNNSLRPYVGFNQNAFTELQGKEYSAGILHSSGFGIGLNSGEISYSETKTEYNPKQFVAKIEGRLDAKAEKKGISAIYDLKINPEFSVLFRATDFKFKGKIKTTVTAYGAPPFENQVSTEKQETHFYGKGQEREMGISIGSENFRMELLASGINMNLNYQDPKMESNKLEGLTGKLGFKWIF